MAERGVLPTRNSSRARSKMSTFASTDMPTVSTMPASPGRVRVAPNRLSAAMISRMFNNSARSAITPPTE
jgi:hypothetical protein